MDSHGKQPFWPLMRVVGKKAFFAFCIVTFLVVAILAATNVVSKYALKAYTEDQIRRIHWDGVVYQTSGLSEVATMKTELAAIPGVTSIQEAGSIKLSLGTFMHLRIGNQTSDVPWFMMTSAENLNLLPPELRPANGATLTALVGPQLMIGPYLKEIRVGQSIEIFHKDPFHPGPETELFSAPIQQLVTPERLELVKFFLDQFGSATFIPDGCLIFVVPPEMFDREAPRITTLVHRLSKPQPVLGTLAEGQAQDEPTEENMGAMLVGESVHLLSLDRNRIVSGWDLDGSYQRASELIGEIKNTANQVSFDSFAHSELATTLGKMAQVSRQIALLTVLISFPVLWLAWLFAGTVASLVILNQRRLVGLLRLRGASYEPIRKSLLLAIGAGGILGGSAGAAAGTLLPYLLYRLAGVEIPMGLLFSTVQEPWVLALFILFGTAFGLLVGRKVTQYLARITPLEASRREAPSEASEFRYRFTKWQLLCALLGGSKLLAWIVGFTPRTELLQRVDHLLNFVGAAFFLYGLSAIVVSRSEFLERILRTLARPLAGDLDWFAVRNMLTRPHRIMTVILVAALTFGVVVYPQITSRSFYDKTVRALRLNLGSDIAIRYDATELLGGQVQRQAVGQSLDTVGKQLAGVKEQIQKLGGAHPVSASYTFSIPGSFYIPGQTSLQLYLIERPEEFLQGVYYENNLGMEKPFGTLLRGLGKDDVLVSKGFREAYEQLDSQPLGLGDAQDGEVAAKVAGTIYLLPGLSQFMTQDRESLSTASVEFINSIAQDQPYVVGRLDSGRLRQLEGSLVNVIVHAGGMEQPDTAIRELARLRQEGKIPPFAALSTEHGERERLSSDMFIYLALENIKVFLTGGILVALAGLIAIALVNFIERKRTFALVRLRGASPRQMIRMILADLVAPLTLGAGIGVPVGLVTGYGLTNAIFALPRAASILQILPVHLTLSWLVAAIIAGLLVFFFVAGLLLSSWIFQKTAREAVME